MPNTQPPVPTTPRSAPAPSRSHLADRTVRVATANVLHGISLRSGAVDLGALADGLAALDADVLALQEVDRDLPRTGRVDQPAALAEALGLQAVFAPALLGDPDAAWDVVPDGWDAGAPPHGDHQRGAYGLALLTRLPLREVGRLPLPGGGAGHRARAASPANPGWDREPRVALTAVVDVAGTPLRITTAHLSYLPVRALAQLRAAAASARHPGGGPAVLLGDLNLPAWAVRTALRGWRHAGTPATYPAGRPRLAVDQVLVAGRVRVAAARTSAACPSDHLAVVADLVLP